MKKITLILISMLFSVFSVYSNVTANQMVNIAGKQRMLSQKMAKVYLMNAYGANLNSLRNELNISKIIFERNIETLSQNSDRLFSPEVKKAINKEVLTWNNFKALIEKPVDEKLVSKILILSEQLLKDAHQVVVSIKKEKINSGNFSTNSDLLDIIDKSGKQRMLSQRLCLFFVAKKFALKNKSKSLREEAALYSTYNELDEALIDLLNTSLNTMTVEETIGDTMLTFENLRSQKNSFLNGTASLNLVYSTTNKLTKKFDNLTSRYSELKTDDIALSAR